MSFFASSICYFHLGHSETWNVQLTNVNATSLQFFKWVIPGLFLVMFGLFQTSLNTILQLINVKKCPSSMQHCVSNPQPSERETPPITTRPRLTPNLPTFNSAVIHQWVVFPRMTWMDETGRMAAMKYSYCKNWARTLVLPWFNDFEKTIDLSLPSCRGPICHLDFVNFSFVLF